MDKADLLQQREEIFKKVEEKCSKHDINLVTRKEGKAFCPECAIERISKEKEELRKSETIKALHKNKKWLKTRSIVTDKKMLNMTFENYDEVDAETLNNKQKAIEIARGYFKGNKHNALFSGKFGTGKSHLSMAVLNEINKHANKKLLFVAMDELMRRIKSSFNNQDSPYQEDRVVNMLIEADILVLDDIGAEVGSVNKKSQAGNYNVQVLNGILNGRTSKPTIFTTNLSKADIIEIYDGRIESRMMRGVTKASAVQFKETDDKRSTINY